MYTAEPCLMDTRQQQTHRTFVSLDRFSIDFNILKPTNGRHPIMDAFCAPSYTQTIHNDPDLVKSRSLCIVYI